MRRTWPRAGRGERRVDLFDAHVTCSQMNLRPRFRSIAPGQQPGLEQDLKAVADAEHRSAGIGEGLDRGHHRREARDGAGAQVVAVREAAGQDDHVSAAERRVLVPDELGLLAEHVLRGVVGVVVAVRSGKDDDGEFHVSGPLLRFGRHDHSIDATGPRSRSPMVLASTLSATSPTSRFASSADAGVDLELEILALPHVADAGVAHRVQRVGDGAPLGIEDRGFQGDEYALSLISSGSSA